jgi:hypothetical protein
VRTGRPLPVILLICTCVIPVETRADWSYYPSDEFNDENLRPRWAAAGLEVKMKNGRAQLTRDGQEPGRLMLRSAWAQGTKIPLIWPWAMETKIISVGDSADTNQTVGMFIHLAGQAAETELLAGLQGNDVFCRLGDRSFNDWAESIPNCQSGEMFVRIEGVGTGGHDVRTGFKRRESDAWHWSSPATIPHAVDHAKAIGFMIEGANAPQADKKTSVRLDYLRFEGECFQFAKRGKIEYVRPEVPPLPDVQIEGKFYEAMVPDTIDFARRAALALNACTAVTDPDADFEPYSHIYFNPDGWQESNQAYNPDMERTAPVLIHDYHGYNTGIGEGILESVPLLALASGDLGKLEIGNRMFKTMRCMIDEQGQTYAPLRGRPWALLLTWWLDNQLTGPWHDSGQYPVGEPWRTRALSTLAAWYLVQPHPVLAEEMRRMVDNLTQAGDIAPTSTRGLVRAWQAIAYQPALDLALQYADQAMAMFADNGSWKGHFHVHTQTLLAMFDLAVATGDKERLERVRRAYEFARTKGWPSVGVFPEGTDSPPYPCETCELAEMIQLGILLSRAGAGDYWDDVDRWARNQFAEQQLIETDWIKKLTDRLSRFDTPTPENYPGTTDVTEKIVGGFSSYGSINEWSMLLPHSPGGAVGCCTGNGSVAVYTTWKNILTRTETGLRVNLLMNRASQWADVDSWIPYRGKVHVSMKQALPLWVRAPEWVKQDEFICRVGGKPRDLKWDGRHASPGIIQAGETVSFLFPISTRKVSTKIGEIDCRLTIKGNTVIDVDPSGKICPIYERGRYAADQAPMKKVTRFAPVREVDW